MKQVIASFIIVFVSLLICFELSAQYNTTAFYAKTYKAADGLPDSYVLSIYQDRQHYIWAGTYSGLSRFDGKSFTNFGMKNGLPDLFISAITEDAQNRIWIGTPKGLGYLINNQYTQAKTDDNSAIDFIFSFSYVVKNKLWAFTSKGLYELNGVAWIKKRPVKGYEDQPCRYAVAKDDCIYYCYASEIFKVKTDGSVSLVASGKNDNGPFFIQFRKSGERFFTSTPKGLMELKGSILIPVYEKQLNGQMIYGFFLDSKKRMWISTEKAGLLVSEPGNEKELHYNIPYGASIVSNFYEDMDGNMWLANFNGLIRVKKSFFDVLTPETPGMQTRYFTLSNADNAFYVFANMYGFYEFRNWAIQRKYFPDRNNVLDKNAPGAEILDAICIDKDKNFWTVTRERRLLKISPAGHEERIYPSGKADTSSNVYYIAMNQKDGSLYLCGKKLYIYCNGAIHEFRSKQNNNPITNAWRAFNLKNGDMLINSRSDGLWLVKLTGEAYSLAETSGIPVSSRLMFTEDKSGHIWVTYPGTGVARYYWANDSTLKKETDITTKNALPNDVMEAIAIDGQNRLWAATLSGLAVIDSISTNINENYLIYNIGKDHGLDFAISSGLTRLTTDNRGDIWFSSNDIVVRFRINELMTHTNPPVTHIESVQLNMQETDWRQWADSLAGPFMLPYKLNLPYHQHTITFSFKGLNFDNDEDTWYSHRMLGMDSAWMPPSKSNSFSFIRLPPGTYTFEVKSRRTNSEWSEPVSFSFTIHPPFWQTWWFRGLGIAIASFILVLIFRTQLKRVSKKAALENQLRDLEIKALKSQMNPHFVYNALNSIQSLVIDNRQQEALDYMVKFSRLLRQVLNHSEANVVTLEKELDTLKLYIQLESLRLNYSLNYSIDVDENILTEKEMIPPLILQPFVENALWHGLGNKEGDKKLSIAVYADDQWLFCRIDDNGIGRTENQKQKTASYKEGPRGMEITINRLKAYNEDKNNDSITIEDNIHPDGSPAGTTVTIRIRRK